MGAAVIGEVFVERRTLVCGLAGLEIQPPVIPQLQLEEVVLWLVRISCPLGSEEPFVAAVGFEPAIDTGESDGGKAIVTVEVGFVG